MRLTPVPIDGTGIGGVIEWRWELFDRPQLLPLERSKLEACRCRTIRDDDRLPLLIEAGYDAPAGHGHSPSSLVNT